MTKKERAKIIDKAKKLKELADRGVDGEQETAKRMYDAYKKKYDLTDEDVNEHSYTEDFYNQIKDMTDDEIIEFIAKGLIVLGIGLLFSFLFSSVVNKNSKNKTKDVHDFFTEVKTKTKKTRTKTKKSNSSGVIRIGTKNKINKNEKV